jgi:multisubunit Na+/H+ antiporter MnhF subunit
MDTFAEILWYTAFISPLLVLPVVYKITKGAKIVSRVLCSIVASIAICMLLAFFAIIIIFRNGMGPS